MPSMKDKMLLLAQLECGLFLPQMDYWFVSIGHAAEVFPIH